MGTGLISILTLSAAINPQEHWFRESIFIFTGLVGYFILGAYVNRLKFSRSLLYLGLVLGSVWTIVGIYILEGTLGAAYSQFFLDASSFSIVAASVTLPVFSCYPQLIR